MLSDLFLLVFQLLENILLESFNGFPVNCINDAFFANFFDNFLTNLINLRLMTTFFFFHPKLFFLEGFVGVRPTKR